jgi:hypothetical protein
MGGYDSAINGNRYLISNIILLTGIAMYAWKRIPIFRTSAPKHPSELTRREWH